ncbi:hypothetical protein CYMTET_42963 [Cymbomonas tetramitiformis]|uniref:Uncharacterized protein n=1 Tax=Cymbomonas tetramitiformis TaxID=36881 RepID=A0AAE0C485_9CHLO|nr:hypothetical protein CYMTET_42963 [Cymbomonas tetramitiformis]
MRHPRCNDTVRSKDPTVPAPNLSPPTTPTTPRLGTANPADLTSSARTFRTSSIQRKGVLIFADPKSRGKAHARSLTGERRPPSATKPSSKFRPAAGRECRRQGRAPLGLVDPNKLKERKTPNSKGKEVPDPVLAYSGTLTWLDSPQLWLDAMHTLQWAETGYEEATLTVQTRSGKQRERLFNPR